MRMFCLAGALAVATPAVAGPLSNEEFVLAHYPHESYERGEQGTVGFKVELDLRNRVRSCVVTQSSGFKALDTGTCDVMLEFARVKAPLGPDRAPMKSYDGTLVWKLPDKPNHLVVDVPAITADKVTPVSMARDKVTCRMSNKIDHWYIMVRECHTKADWQRAELMAKATTAAMQDVKGGQIIN